MRHYLLDASVLVDFLNNSYEPKAVRVRAAVTKLVTLKNERKARLYIPNVCMAECSKAFARAAYDFLPANRAGDTYRRYVDALLDLVSSRRGRAGSLSGVDGIIIAMGRRLVRRFGDDDVLIVTAENDIVTVCQKFRPDLPSAAYAQAHVPDA